MEKTMAKSLNKKKSRIRKGVKWTYTGGRPVNFRVIGGGEKYE